jgi:hypothetical protein
MTKINFKPLQLAALFILILIGCKKDEPKDFTLSRQFAPSTVSGANGETQVKISWPASLFTLPTSNVSYQLDVSKTSTFDVIDFTTTQTDLSVTLSDDKLAIRQDYYARVKALGANGSNESNFVVSTAFRITGEQLVLPVADGDVIDNKVILRFKPNSGLTKVTIFPPAGAASFDVTVTPAELAANQKIVSGLISAKDYVVEGYAGVKYKGTSKFTTKSAIAGNIIDLRGISTATRPSILTDTLAIISSGSVVLLKKGSVYKMTAAYSFSKSVTIQSGLDFGSELAQIQMVGTTITSSTSFNIVAGSTIDSLVFKDIVVKGNHFPGANSFNLDYLMNMNQIATLKKVRLENVNAKILRGLVRVQAATQITNLVINNCVIDSLREFAIAASGGGAWVNIKITNSTVARARKFIDHRVNGNLTTLLENCTFNEVISGATPIANAIIDFSGTGIVGGAITIRNCIFGKTWDESGNGTGTLAYGIRYNSPTPAPAISGTYNTNDFLQTSNPMVGLTSYTGSSTTLFTDPSTFNFKIKDAGFAGKASAGDPRWR